MENIFKTIFHLITFHRETTAEMLEMIKDFPSSYDWRNKEGEDFVTPVRNQGSCGSCYSFASMGCLEAGVAIASNGRIKPVFSPQYIVSCSNYSQGCDGGKRLCFFYWLGALFFRFKF